MENAETLLNEVESDNTKASVSAQLEEAYHRVSFVEPSEDERKCECVNRGCCRGR